jgi:hypothetical protein
MNKKHGERRPPPVTHTGQNACIPKISVSREAARRAWSPTLAAGHGDPAASLLPRRSPNRYCGRPPVLFHPRCSVQKKRTHPTVTPPHSTSQTFLSPAPRPRPKLQAEPEQTHSRFPCSLRLTHSNHATARAPRRTHANLSASPLSSAAAAEERSGTEGGHGAPRARTGTCVGT